MSEHPLNTDESGLVKKRIGLILPLHMIAKLDMHAKKRGVTRQALIKMWLADRLESAA